MGLRTDGPRWLGWLLLLLGAGTLAWGLLVVTERLVVTSTPDTPPFVFTPLVLSSLPGGAALLLIGGAALLRRRRA